MISGYLFSVKADIGRDIWRRFVRLYVPAYIMIIVTMLCGRLHADNLEEIIKEFIWPTHFWFVGAIFVYSIVLYVLIQKFKIEDRRAFTIFGLTLLLVDIILYVFCIPDKTSWVVEDAYISIVPFRSIYSIFAFVLGYYLRKNRNRIRLKISFRLIVFLAAAFFIVFYGFKWLLNKGVVPMTMQIMSQPLTILSALFIFLSFAMLNLNQKLSGTKMERIINGLSRLSRESYLVQFLIIAGIAAWHIAFPFNLILCVVLVMIAAMLLHVVDGQIVKMILREQ